MITSRVLATVPLPLIPPKLNNPEGFLPQADSNPSCAIKALANVGFNPFCLSNLSYIGVIIDLNSSLEVNFLIGFLTKDWYSSMGVSCILKSIEDSTEFSSGVSAASLVTKYLGVYSDTGTGLDKE